MSNTPAQAKRRKNKFGSGIVSRNPAPQGTLLFADADNFIVDNPGYDRFKAAAKLERCAKYYSGYAAIFARLGGGVGLDSTILPYRYTDAGALASFVALWTAMIGATAWPFDLYLPKIGDVVLADDGAGRPVTISDVEPACSLVDVQTAFLNPPVPVAGFAFPGGSGLIQVPVDVPFRTITYSEQVSDVYPATVPAVNFFVTAAPLSGGTQLSICQMAIDLLLWGSCVAPTSADVGEGYSPTFEAGTYSAEWLDYIECCAGRYLWQMAIIDTLIQAEDLENQDKGGHGGIVQEGTPLGALMPNPDAQYPGPPAPNPWSDLNDFLNDNASDVIQAIVEWLE